MSNSLQSTVRVSRRTLAQGAAWTIPVIVLAQAAPAVTASTSLISSFAGAGTCYQANNQFGFWFTLVTTQSLTITGVSCTTPNYSPLTNHAPLWYITNEGNKVPSASKPWTITAGASTDITIPVQWDAGAAWPVAISAGQPNATGDGSGFFAPGATFTRQVGRDTIKLCLTGHDASNSPVAFCISMAAGYPLPLPTEGHCPSNKPPTYVNNDTHYSVIKVPPSTVNVGASAACPC